MTGFERIYLGLGSNLGDREGYIDRAIALLRDVGTVLAISPLYETEPWGVLDQPRFLNGACALVSKVAPLSLLRATQAIERELGRLPGPRNGPRQIDIDILLYGHRIIALPGLTIPHPGMRSRATVLAPLADIASCVRHPESGLTIREHLAALEPISGVALYPPGLASGVKLAE